MFLIVGISLFICGLQPVNVCVTVKERYKSSVFCDLINNNLGRIVRKIQIRNHVKMFKSTLVLV